MEKELKDNNFPELVDYFSAQVLDALLTEGGRGLKSMMYTAMQTSIRWSKEYKVPKISKKKR